MDNLGKALYMATSVLLFILALTASVFLYNRIIESANIALVVSDMGDRAESSFGEAVDHSRLISRAEIVGTLMQIDSMEVDEVRITSKSGSSVTYKPYKEYGQTITGYMINPAGRRVEINKYSFDSDIFKGSYLVDYTSSSKTLTYKYVGEG